MADQTNQQPQTPAKKAKAPKYDNVFKANPKADKLHVTSDGQVFVEEQWAKSHAKGLEDKAIKVVTRNGEAETEEAE
ncbi:hypothetical protein LJ737_19900 [Hymenobacter sp. 15J16-1T3B]|uniref:hypothetical protein n=1 Tax=Hymenobacter sp. 15J16-1T3B TaxID=2886941 RepID=UPI001D11700E|nr:hypothetical protein [Hymenobacter sp. 15J16-1T3B]MCC3159516.1 hypothetical protein [Hymenobacter sp. 15J16-1T3B]